MGKKQHKTSDMWWMKAFDKTLKHLNTEDGKVIMGRDTCGGLEKITTGTWGGLYEGFVRGEGLRGTLMLGEAKESQTQERGEKSVEDTARKAEYRAKKSKRLLEKSIRDDDSTCNLSKASHERRNRRRSEVKAIKTKSEHRARRAAKTSRNNYIAIPSSKTEMNVP